jgi:hypothetical protein
MTSVAKKLPSTSLPTLKHETCKTKGKGSLIDLPTLILQLIFSFLAPRQNVRPDPVVHKRKQVHNFALELLCAHSTFKMIGIPYLWAYRVADIDYDGNDRAKTICLKQCNFKFSPDTLPGVERNSLVKGLYCTWGSRCSNCENTYDELQGSFLFPLVSRFDNLTELVLQIPVSTTVLGLILQACHLNLQKLDYQGENRAIGSSPLPPLPQLSQLIIRCYYTERDETAHKIKCTSDICTFLEAVTCNLREIVIQGATLEPSFVLALTDLRGLVSLQILQHQDETNISNLNEFPKEFPQACKLKTLSMPPHFWYLFPQGYFEALQVLNLKGDYLKGSIQRNPRFTMALRSVSIGFPLDLASLETLGKAPCLEHLEIILQFSHKQTLQQIAHAGAYDAHAFPKLKDLTMNPYYLTYMQNFKLPMLTQLELSSLVYNADLGLFEVPEIPWNHLLLSLKMYCYNRRVSWNSQASFPKLDAMDLDFSSVEGSFLCQFPALRKLRVESCDFCLGLTNILSRFPKLRTLEISMMLKPIRIPVKYISTNAMTTPVLNSLMAYDEVDTVEFYSLHYDDREELWLYWHNTPSSIRLWKYLPSTKFFGSDINNVYIIFSSSDLDNKVILSVVQWFLKCEVIPYNLTMKSDDSVEATISLIMKDKELKDSFAFKALVEGIRGLERNCEIRILSPSNEET